MTWNFIAIKKESRAMLRMATPAIIAQLAQMSMGTIDTIMSGNLSTEALAAISVGNNLFIPLLVLVLGILMALNPMVSRAMGAQQTLTVSNYCRQGIYLAIFLTLPSLFIIPQASWAMQLIGVEPAIQPVVNDYLGALRWGLVFLFLFLTLRFVNEGLFSTDAIMYISIAAIPVNIALNFIFMYGYLGLPAMGAVGLGYATSIVWFLMCLTLSLYSFFNFKKQGVHYADSEPMPQWTIIRAILKLAVPMSLTIFLEVLLFASVGLFIGRYALEMIAAHQIALNIASVIYMIPLGLSIAVSARVGHAAGRHNIPDAKLSAYLGLVYSITIGIIATIVITIFPSTIVAIYTREQAVIDLTLQLIFIASVFLIVDSIQVVTASALRGLHDTFVPMLLAGFSYWIIGFPVGYFLAEIQGMQAVGYWYGFVSGLCSASILMFSRLRIILARYRAMDEHAQDR